MAELLIAGSLAVVDSLSAAGSLPASASLFVVLAPAVYELLAGAAMAEEDSESVAAAAMDEDEVGAGGVARLLPESICVELDCAETHSSTIASTTRAATQKRLVARVIACGGKEERKWSGKWKKGRVWCVTQTRSGAANGFFWSVKCSETLSELLDFFF